MKKDYYKILEISPSASKAEIKASYRKLAMKYHPDRNKSKQAHDIFINVNEAYAYLTDDKNHEAPIYEKKQSHSPNSNDELKRRMQWAKNYAKYKKIKEENIAAISYQEIQSSSLGWSVPLVSWLSIGYALLIFLDFLVLTPTAVSVKYSYDYMNSTTNSMIFYLESLDEKSDIQFDEFAVKVRELNKLNLANPKVYYCEFSPIFNQDIYLSFKVAGEKIRLFNHQSTYAGFYVFLFMLLLPLITIFSKGPNMLHVFSCYFITSIVFLVELILSISLIA